MLPLHSNKWFVFAYYYAITWTSKLSHIRVKCNHWCLVWWISFNSWEVNRSTGSTLLQKKVPIGKLTFVISWCTKNRICCIFAMWMMSFIVWKGVVNIWLLVLSVFIFSSYTWIICFIYYDFKLFLPPCIQHFLELFELLLMVQPHIILVIICNWA